jgi:hypothetical protein
MINEMPIDRHLYESREYINIEALDTFMMIGTTMPDDNLIYVVDIDQFTRTKQIQIEDLLADAYQFDLLYYGFVIKYWPQLIKNVFYDMIINEADLFSKYTDLAIPQNILRERYMAEKAIVNKQYSLETSINVYNKPNHILTAITKIQAVVLNSNILINIRNIFDLISVSHEIPEIRAYVTHGGDKYVLKKSYSGNVGIQFPTNLSTQQVITMAINIPGRNIMYFSILQNGSCIIRAQWNEEDNMEFASILKQIQKYTSGIITSINNMGRYVFNKGISLEYINKYNIKYKSLSARIIWKKIMPAGTFKIVTGMLNNYVNAGIISSKDIPRVDKYDFLFRKGMYQFDRTIIDSITCIPNQYMYLTNIQVKQKWDQNYSGHLARIQHRSADVIIEIVDISEDEFSTFYLYMISFIYNVTRSQEFCESINVIKSYKNVKKLKKLNEQDPNLFNLKKYGDKKVVYSRLCQSKQQPVMYTDDEIKKMSTKDIKSLTKYWNFTSNSPVHYGCPSRGYSHLSFLTGVHPKGYCIPCCNKKLHTPGSQREKMYNKCIEEHSHDTAREEVSKHIMSYGKYLDIGRLSKLPKYIVSDLFRGDDIKHQLLIYGVPQNNPSSNDNIQFIQTFALRIKMKHENE